MWFSEARYGMFVHWGAYSVAGRGEWVANRECIPFEEYRDRYAARWSAESFDPAAWARLAKEAGMGYVVLTTRHHDGFCLWDTQTTDFCATRLGPKRDLVRPFVEAVRAEGLKVGFYYSVADWFHPDYPSPHARDWPTGWPDEAKRARFISYYQSQLRELFTGYGKIDVLWYDGCAPSPLDGSEANRLVREWQPEILINERNGEPFDFRVSEQSLKEKQGLWESCITLNDNWAYHAGDHAWKDARHLVKMLVTTAGKAGNLLLNVGPKPDGTIPEPSVRILKEAGAWLRRNREFLPDSERSSLSWTNCAQFTVRGDVVFAHLFASPGKEWCLAELSNPVRSVRHVATGRFLPFEKKDNRLFIRELPEPDPIADVLAIEVEGTPEPWKRQESFWIPE